MRRRSLAIQDSQKNLVLSFAPNKPLPTILAAKERPPPVRGYLLVQLANLVELKMPPGPHVHGRAPSTPIDLLSVEMSEHGPGAGPRMTLAPQRGPSLLAKPVGTLSVRHSENGPFVGDDGLGSRKEFAVVSGRLI